MHEEVWLHAPALLLLRCTCLCCLKTTELALADASINRLGHVHRLRASDGSGVSREEGKVFVSSHSFDGALSQRTLGRAFHLLRPAQVDAELDEA